MIGLTRKFRSLFFLSLSEDQRATKEIVLAFSLLLSRSPPFECTDGAVTSRRDRCAPMHHEKRAIRPRKRALKWDRERLRRRRLEQAGSLTTTHRPFFFFFSIRRPPKIKKRITAEPPRRPHAPARRPRRRRQGRRQGLGDLFDFDRVSAREETRAEKKKEKTTKQNDGRKPEKESLTINFKTFQITKNGKTTTGPLRRPRHHLRAARH